MEGLDVSDDHNGKLMITVKAGKFEIEEKESFNLRESDDDFSSASE